MATREEIRNRRAAQIPAQSQKQSELEAEAERIKNGISQDVEEGPTPAERAEAEYAASLAAKQATRQTVIPTQPAFRPSRELVAFTVETYKELRSQGFDREESLWLSSNYAIAEVGAALANLYQLLKNNR